MSLRRLGLERIDLYQLHRIDPQVPVAESARRAARAAGRGQDPPHRALRGQCRASCRRPRRRRRSSPSRTSTTSANATPSRCWTTASEHGIGFIPWFPLATGGLTKPGGPLAELSEEHDASPSQLALAWLLRRSPVMLPIPGTSSVAHLEENVAAAELELSDEQFEALSAATA